MRKIKLFLSLLLLTLGISNAWAEETATLSISSGVTTNKTLTDGGGNSWSVTSDGSYTSNTKYIQVGTNSKEVTYLKLSTSSFSTKSISKIQVWGTSKANTNVTIKIYVGGNKLGESSKFTTQNASSGGTEYSIENTNDYTGEILIEISRPTSATGAIYFNKAIVTYSEPGAPEKVLSSIEISGDLTKKTYEEGEELDLAGLTVNATYDDASTKVVTNDVEWSYTPNPLTQGTTSVDITASYEEKIVTKTITGLTVNEHIITPNEYCIVPNNAFWGTSYNGSDANAATTLSGTQNDITILHTKSGSNLYVNDTQTRVYTNHAMQISVPSGYVITSIAFTADGNNWAGTHTANVGKMTDSKNWAGFANEVTITFGGTCRITKICVNYIKDAKYVLTITEPAVGIGTLVVKDGANVLTSGAEIYEGTELIVTATPATGYEGGTIVVKDGSDNDVTSTVYADGVLTMPAYNITISAAFEQKQCTLLGTPSVSATTTYNSATLSWETVANAAKYSVKVGTADAFETTETSYKATDLEAETIYTYQVKAIAADDQIEYCDSKAAEGSFTTSAAPVATLTLKDIVGTTTQTGALNGTITLPTEAAECSKTFVGWDADESCNHAPTYARGAEYTLAAETQTLYAVYADGEGGGNFTITKTMSEIVSDNGYTVSSGSTATCYTSLTLDENITLSTTGSANCGSFWSDPREWRLYQNKSGNAIVTATNGCSLTSVKFIFTYSNTGTLLNNGAAIKSGTAVSATGTSVTYTVGNSGSATNGQIRITAIEVSYSKDGEYSNYSTTCAAAPKAEVNPTTVSATAAGANDKVEVTYENVNTANVAVALYNDAACTEAFTADWLTASLDGDKNIAYTVAATTLYTERKAYIKLTAPETTGATEPAVVVIPVTQAGKDKVFASLEELVAAITPTMAGIEVTVTLTNEVIQDFYTSGSYTNGIALNVPYEGGVKVIEIYCKNVPAEWVKGGKVSGTITCPWKLYNSTWELCPTAWTELTYTAPATVSSIAVSGNPTKTTYIDGEKFDPAGLVVTATYSDASTGAIDAALVDWTFDPATLVKGQTSVNVTAKFNSVSSAAYEVTGLTVNDIPTKTVAEFIAAGGTRCYLEGIVSGLTEGNSMKYGNFDLTDASGKIYVYGCLNAAGESQKFADLGVKNGDKIKVIADEYELYGGTKQEAKNVQYVSHVSAATITIADITMEVGETKTIAATVVPAEAEVTYTIKENAANAISLSGNTITANAVGTATITATVAEGATYMGNSVDFTVKVTPKTNKVVILAEREGQWYALKAEYLSGKTDRLVAIPVDYFNGTLYNVAEEVKATIEWNSIVEGDKVSFLNDGKYLKGKTSTTLIFEAGEEGLYQWNKDDYTMVIGTTERTFLYNGEAFRNFATSNAGQIKDGITYSSLPVVTAPIYVNLNTSSVKTVEKGIFSVADGKFVQFSTGNLQYEVEYNKWSFAENQYDYVGEANINVGNPNYEGKIDMFGWSADGKFGVNPSNKNEDYYGTFQDWGDLVNEADWYTLSADEWKYLLNTRANAANLKQIAKVNNGEKDIVGIMLFPDAWAMPADVNVAAAYDDYFKVNIYNYTLEQWQKLEAVGAVFLPAAGRRTGGWGNTTISPHMVGVVELDSDGHYKYYDNGNIYCYYWTSTINESNDVSYLHNIQALGGDEYTIGTGAVWGEKGRYGQSVRLVKAIEPDYKREVRQGYYGTICLGNGGQMIGASLFGLSYYNEAQGLLYMDEEGTVMTAGNPYIFLPNEGADSLYVFYDETTAIEAGTVNGLVGSFESKPLDADGTNYIMKDNKIMKVVGEYASVGAYKAYIKLGDVSKNEPAPVPGRRRVAIGQAPQVATGMESVDASAQPVKMIIDGQLYILRGEKMYDAQGKLVK